MTPVLILLRLLGAAFLALIPLPAFAAGGADIASIFVSVVTAFWPLWIVAAVLVLVVCGFILVTATDESKLERARGTIIAVVMGGIITTIIWVLGPTGSIGLLYNGTAGFIMTSSASADAIGLEAIGIADWIATIAVLLGILFVIIAAIRAVASFGDEAKYANARNAAIQAVIGLVVIAAAYVFKIVFYDVREPSPLIALFASKVAIVLGFINLIAVGIIVYAGFRMVISFGNDEAFSSAKSLAIRAALGILIILVSYALVIIVANIFA